MYPSLEDGKVVTVDKPSRCQDNVASHGLVGLSAQGAKRTPRGSFSSLGSNEIAESGLPSLMLALSKPCDRFNVGRGKFAEVTPVSSAFAQACTLVNDAVTSTMDVVEAFRPVNSREGARDLGPGTREKHVDACAPRSPSSQSSSPPEVQDMFSHTSTAEYFGKLSASKGHLANDCQDNLASHGLVGPSAQGAKRTPRGLFSSLGSNEIAETGLSSLKLARSKPSDRFSVGQGRFAEVTPVSFVFAQAYTLVNDAVASTMDVIKTFRPVNSREKARDLGPRAREKSVDTCASRPPSSQSSSPPEIQDMFSHTSTTEHFGRLSASIGHVANDSGVDRLPAVQRLATLKEQIIKGRGDNYLSHSLPELTRAAVVGGFLARGYDKRIRRRISEASAHMGMQRSISTRRLSHDTVEYDVIAGFTPDDVAEAAHIDVARWLQDTGKTAKSLGQGAVRDRIDTAKGLQTMEAKAKRLSEDAMRDRAETAKGLQEMEAEGKHFQNNAALARANSVTWLPKSEEQAKVREYTTAGNREKALTWLTTKGKIELERAQLRTGSANAPEMNHETNEPGTPAMPRPIKGSGTMAKQADNETSQQDLENNHYNVFDIDEITTCNSCIGEDSSFVSEVAASGASGFSNASIVSHYKHTVATSPCDVQAQENDVGGAPSVITDGFEAFRGFDDSQSASSFLSADRTAPALWVDLSRTPLAREGSVAPTEPVVGGFGSMLKNDDEEWSTVSLSRTPTFDALNSHFATLGGAPAAGRANMLPREANGFGKARERLEPLGRDTSVRRDGAKAVEVMFGDSSELSSNTGGSSWVDNFSRSHQMALAPGLYGVKSFPSNEARASLTICNNPTKDLVPPRASNGTASGEWDRYVETRSWNCFDTPDDCGSSEIQYPAEESQRRNLDQLDYLGNKNATLRASDESSWLAQMRRSHKRWSKARERSQQYIRQWSKFLSQVYKHFDGEVQLRKKLSKICRAHPDVSNEVAFVALALSRGRAFEATAVLHLARAKEEATLVAMMLDVTAFIALARRLAERQHRLQQLEKQRSTTTYRQVQHSSHPRHEILPQRQHRWDIQHHCSLPRNICQSKQQREANVPRRWQRDSSPADVNGAFVGVGGDPRGGGRKGVVTKTWRHEGKLWGDGNEYGRAYVADGTVSSSQANLRRSESASAPLLLPPLTGLLCDTPPSPNTLKIVLSTSSCLAPGVRKGFGLRPEMDEEESQPELQRHNTNTRRGEMDSLRVHAKLRQDRIAEITGQKVCGNIRTTCFHKLADQLLRETRTLERDNYYLDTRLREPKKKKRKRAGSTSGINWGQASSASFLSGQTGGLLSKAVSASACAPEGVSDTGSYPA